MEKPSNLLLKFSRRLFSDPNQQAQFVEALVHPQPFPPCILWCRRSSPNPFTPIPGLPWQPDFVDRLPIGLRPGQHPLHSQGHFYCLDFSSVFAASVLLAISSPVQTVLDMCAAPGGKSVFAWKALQPCQLFSNEVIGKRLAPLIANLNRCQISPVQVFQRDSQLLAETLAERIEVVIVDAPCTGQSLLAKGEKADGCFHPVQINRNANRQKRILANSAQIVAPQGYLAYMTCAYSPEENEQVGEWLLDKFPHFQPVPVPQLQAFQSHLSERPCYRLMPQTGLGAGAFTMLFKNSAVGASCQRSLPPIFPDLAPVFSRGSTIISG